MLLHQFDNKKGVRAFRGYFGTPIRPKNENSFSQVSSTMAQVYKSGIYSIFTVAMVTKMAAKIVCK